MTGPVAPQRPKRTHRLNVGIGGITYYTQEIPTGSNIALNIPHDIVTAMMVGVNAANPITIRIDPL